MKPQQIMSAVLLLSWGLLGNALGGAVRAGGHPALHNGTCNSTINGAGIASVRCLSPTVVPLGHPSGLSYRLLAAQVNASWTSMTETYTTTSVNVATPSTLTETYTVLSTELTSTTLDMRTTTQTIVEIAGYSTMNTYTTTFLAPASRSTYSTVETITTTSSELLVPSVDTLTLSGKLPPSVLSFPTMSTQKRGLVWDSVKNSTGALADRNPVKPAASGNFTASLLPTLAFEQASPYLEGVAITQDSSPLRGADPSIQAESFKEYTKSSSTDVLAITVTNTYYITPTSKHRHKSTSGLKDTTSWLIVSPAASNSTLHLPAALTMHNTSAVIHATTTTKVPDSTSTIIRTSSVEAGMTMTAQGTGTASSTSTSGSSVILSGLVLHVVFAVLAMTLSFVV